LTLPGGLKKWGNRIRDQSQNEVMKAIVRRAKPGNFRAGGTLAVGGGGGKKLSQRSESAFEKHGRGARSKEGSMSSNEGEGSSRGGSARKKCFRSGKESGRLLRKDRERGFDTIEEARGNTRRESNGGVSNQLNLSQNLFLTGKFTLVERLAEL